MDTTKTKVYKGHPLNPGMIEVNLFPPPEPASEPNDTTEEPAPSITNAAPTNDEDLEANPKIDSNPKPLLKIHQIHQILLCQRQLPQKMILNT